MTVNLVPGDAITRKLLADVLAAMVNHETKAAEPESLDSETGSAAVDALPEGESGGGRIAHHE